MKKINLALVLFSLIPMAQAQYREGQPPVLAPQEAPDPSAHYGDVIASFRQRYQAAKQPRVVLYWNESLTDKIAQTVVQKSTNTSSSSESSSGAGGNDDRRGEKIQQSSQSSSNTTEVLGGTSRGESLDPRTDALLRTTFVAALRDASTRFVDRTLALRSTAAAQGGQMDLQQAEMRALKDKAEWLLEVMPVRDGKAALGYAFRVSLRDIRDESLVTELYTPALPPVKQSTIWVGTTGGSGFQKAPPPPPTTREVGYTLAIEVMGQIADSL
ncbi:MAG: hypothetical protein RLZZ200_2656 [Pseudomonadota bacterium]|jgi:hypothetical protein